MRILFFLPDLRGGGAQRTVLNILKYLDPKQFKPLLILGSSTGPYAHLIARNVTVIDLRQSRVRRSIFPLARQIARHRPDVMFSPYPDANVALMLAIKIARWKAPAILRESNHRTAQCVDWGILKRALVKWSYHKASMVVALSEGVRKDLIDRYGVRPSRVQTIYNPVDVEHIRTLSTEKKTVFPFLRNGTKVSLNLIAIGRMVKQKGFDLLVRALSELQDRTIHLTILGEGEERKNLLALVDKLGVEKQVSLPGFDCNPYAWLRAADLFVLSSRWEGFGHVIVEAMACGTPVLATRCPSGPDEIINHGVDGLLCKPESVEDLKESIRVLSENAEMRKRLSVAAGLSANRFDARAIVPQYERLFTKIAYE